MNKKPTFIAYTVKDRGQDQPGIWTRIGAAWQHGNGKGFSIELDAIPTNGRIQLIEPKEAETKDEDSGQ